MTLGWQELATIAVVSLAILSVVMRVTGGWPLRRRQRAGDCHDTCGGCHGQSTETRSPPRVSKGV